MSFEKLKAKIHGNGAKLAFQQMELQHHDIHMQKNESRHRPYTIHKKELKMIMDINVNFKIMKLLEDVIGENPDDLRYGNSF